MDAISVDKPAGEKSVFEGVTAYHWLVVIIASCGWLFDCMDQRLFILAREPALKELLQGNPEALANVKTYIGWATTAMIIGWATGGIIFGMMSDKIGRVKTMIATLLIYSGFTGLSGTAPSWEVFIVYRFLVGLGVGGMFGAATTLVAESVPGNFRSLALGSLQALSASGNIIGSLVSLGIKPGTQDFLWGYSGWRVLFFVGILPALMIIPMVFILKEPEPWKQAKSAGGKKRLGSYAELLANPTWYVPALIAGLAGVGLIFVSLAAPESWPQRPINAMLTMVIVTAGIWTISGNRHGSLIASILLIASALLVAFVAPADWPKGTMLSLIAVFTVIAATVMAKTRKAKEAPSQIRWRRSTIVGLLLGVSGMIGLWGIGFYSPELISTALKDAPQETVDTVRGWGTALQDAGAFLGMMTFTFVASFLNRRIAFLGAFILCLASTMFVFNSLRSATDAYWMLPLMGFSQLAVFAGYSIYFPELFPTRMRGTGVGFCYNTVRYIAAPFPALMGYLTTTAFSGAAEPFRTAAMVMSLVFVVGIVALIWAPETKGKPLPED